MIQLAVLNSKTSSSTKVLMSTRSIKNTNDTSRNYMVSYLSYCAHNNNKALFSSFDELQVYFIGLIRLCSCCQNDYIFSQRFMRTPYMRYRLVALQIPFWQFLFESPYFLTQIVTGFWWYFFSRWQTFTSDVLLAISKSYKLNIQKQNDQRRKVAVNTISKNKFYLFDGRSLSSIIWTFLVCTHRSVRENCKRRRLIIIWPHSY